MLVELSCSSAPTLTGGIVPQSKPTLSVKPFPSPASPWSLSSWVPPNPSLPKLATPALPGCAAPQSLPRGTSPQQSQPRAPPRNVAPPQQMASSALCLQTLYLHRLSWRRKADNFQPINHPHFPSCFADTFRWCWLLDEYAQIFTPKLAA